jgi:hypothetical protein
MWLSRVNDTIPSLLYGTSIHLQAPHNNAEHVDDTRSCRTYLVLYGNCEPIGNRTTHFPGYRASWITAG